MGIDVGGGRKKQCFDVFSSFSDCLVTNICHNTTFGPFNITLGCCQYGTRYMSRKGVHSSIISLVHLIHPECIIQSSTVIVNSIEDGGEGWDRDTILLLIFKLSSILFGISGNWVKRRREKERERVRRGKSLRWRI